MRSLVLLVCLVASIAQASSLDRELIKRVLRRGDYRGCYEAAMRVGERFEGAATLRFDIDAQGRVLDVQVSFDRDLPAFTECLRQEGLKLRFPKGGRFRVTWPVTFRAERG